MSIRSDWRRAVRRRLWRSDDEPQAAAATEHRRAVAHHAGEAMSAPRSLTFLIALAALNPLGCGSARREPSNVPSDATSDARLVRGKELFDRNCYQCHPGGETGLAPAINDKPVPAWLMKTQMRAGLGAMPSF